ncbi:hypothetical protein [Subdoligranulum variabile]|uniref:Uncharacterized protein n=1 Tax=Subdoligranulum variabile DSM 15176 TaxID=411471 RepID=D1PS39_9FIRM|nr:hypothetical protein [Subdoligranulum variabile]EFB74567.1 hypothetical protein SUBVAR_07222 [Subdoligranulum variabile DSM 15176]UWP69528.1 hypothetical protein NQ490_06685 [Subdoligranulum variabile]
MSQLTEIVASVELVTRSLEQTRQGSVAWQRQLAQDVSVIIDQAGGSAGPEIRDCLVAVRSAITAVQQMQASLDACIGIANDWIAGAAGAGTPPPVAGHVMSFGAEPEPDEEVHGHRR